jgi:hypothetical protein
LWASLPSFKYIEKKWEANTKSAIVQLSPTMCFLDPLAMSLYSKAANLAGRSVPKTFSKLAFWTTGSLSNLAFEIRVATSITESMSESTFHASAASSG